jgi:hypothetical protein
MAAVKLIVSNDICSFFMFFSVLTTAESDFQPDVQATNPSAMRVI